jgi:hypothetical protein
MMALLKVLFSDPDGQGPLTVQFLLEYLKVLAPISLVHEMQYLSGDHPPVQHLFVNPDLYLVLRMV